MVHRFLVGERIRRFGFMIFLRDVFSGLGLQVRIKLCKMGLDP